MEGYEFLASGAIYTFFSYNAHCSGRSYYIDLLLIKMAGLAMFQEIWSQFQNPSTN